MSTIQVRIDSKTKKDAKRVLDKVGMDISSAVKVYFKQIIITQSIPFPLLTENGMTAHEEREVLQAEAEAGRGENVTTAKTWKEAKAHLDSLKKK